MMMIIFMQTSLVRGNKSDQSCKACLLLPDGIEPVEVDKLPFEDTFGYMSEVYAEGIAEAVVGLRRAIHEKPGVMYEEYDASDIAYATLKTIGIKDENIQRGLGVTGMVAHIGSGSLKASMEDDSIKTIVLRADMDALPIHEETDVPFRSTYDGVMHACGHDAHTAMLLGAAMVLKNHEAELTAAGGSVRLFFQPAEEGGAGAKAMIDAGAVEGANAAIMLHVGSSRDVGKIVSKKGVCGAACYTFHIVIHGVGAHGAQPHRSKDTIAAAGAVISGIHQIVSRTIDPVSSAVISIGYIHGGKAFNVIPDEVSLGGTIRLFDTSLFDELFSTLTLRVKDIATAYGCTADVINRDGETRLNSRGEEFTIRAFPPNVNDDSIVELGIDIASRMFGSTDAMVNTETSMGCEDFAFLAQRFPSSFFSLGTKHPDHNVGEMTGTQGHNSFFDIDERALPRGSAFMATTAMEYLKKGTTEQTDEL